MMVDTVAAALGGLLQSGTAERTVGYLLVVGVGLYIVYSGFSTWQRKRLIQDTPTETVEAAAVGRTELEGRGYPIQASVTRPFSDEECLVAEYRVERYDSNDDGGKWKTIDSGTIAPAFELDDGTGQMRVDPDTDTTLEFEAEHEEQVRVGANEQTPPAVADFLELYSTVGVPHTDGVTGPNEEQRYTSRWIPIGAKLYVLGAAEQAETDEGTTNGLVLRRDDASGEFIVSAKPARELIGTARWVAPAKMAAGLAVSTAGVYLLLTGPL
ncbi:E3 ubiquitin ligase family protein [Halomicroarcula sp. F28]|uniref:E3 ubiquitin ligase family protein n=1 Tax=Haloarcula salinisoli TaxID=2487746 RepID=UPI001C72D22E|nr:E3 ubiquitin ligase family protein [Halomicroarcula salinisoli]MBX0288194.1 E3 ubiquitin ligase family protein [Halomicroarcula salinisoli]